MRPKAIVLVLLTLLGLSLFTTGCGKSSLEETPTVKTTTVTVPTNATTPKVIQAQDPGADNACNATTNLGAAVKDGTTLPAGTCAVTEIDYWDTKTSVVFGGILPADFPVNDKGTPQTTAWVNYGSLEHVCKDAAKQVEARKNDSTFAGFKFTLLTSCNGDTSKGPGSSPTTAATATATATPTKPAPTVQVPTNDGKYTRLTGPCTGDFPRGDGHVLGIDGGAVVPARTLAFVRYVDHNAATEHLEFGCLLNDTRAGKVSLVSIDIWIGYASLVKSYAAACNQGLGDGLDAAKTMSWNFMYSISLLKSDGSAFGPVPATCPN